MNKPLLVLLAGLAFALNTQAQFTLTKGNVPAPGSDKIVASDTLVDPSVTAGNSGTNQSWDLSQVNEMFEEVTTYYDPSNTDYKSYFPDATHALDLNLGIGSVLAYYKLTDNTFMMLGAAGENFTDPTADPLHAPSKPPYRYLVFPCNYQTAYKDTMNMRFTLPFVYDINGNETDSMRLTRKVNGSIVADGYGTLKTPRGTYPNAMRIKRYDINSNNIEGHVLIGGFGVWVPFQNTVDTTTTYEWYTEDNKSAVAEMVYSGQQTSPRKASYLKNAVVGIPEVAATADNQRVYPNPFSSQLRVSLSGNGPSTVKITDVIGKTVYNKITDANTLSVETTGFSAGMYLLQISNGKNTTTQRIICRN